MMTSLHMAASSGNPLAVKNALEQISDVNERTSPNGFTALHMCVSGASEDTENKRQIVKMLVEAGADLEAKTYDKDLTPLGLAVMRNKPLCVETLLNCGANIHVKDGNGATALHGAAFYGNKNIVSILLQGGADPKLADNLGNTPISLANKGGYKEIHDMLISASNE